MGALVLVVEDDRDVRDLIATTIRGDGHEVAVAADGEEGLRLLTLRRPDLTLLDLLVPKVNGYEFLRRKKQLGIPGPVVLVSAVNPLGAAEQLSELSSVLRLSKPFELEVLLGVVRGLVGPASSSERDHAPAVVSTESGTRQTVRCHDEESHRVAEGTVGRHRVR